MHSPLRTAAWQLTLACVFAVSAADARGQGTSASDAIEHIRLLEQMLREAGIQPPARPASLTYHRTRPTAPIVPEGVKATGMEREVREINQRGDDAPTALARVRRQLSRGDEQEKQAAIGVLDAVQAWADTQMSQVEMADLTDRVTAYLIADEALKILGRGPTGQPFRDYVSGLKADREAWRHIESMAALRRVIREADAVGLTGDWGRIDFLDRRVQEAVKQITAKLKLIARSWPNNAAGEQAAAQLDAWEAQEQAVLAALPAWRYTWNLNLIQVGTDEKTTIEHDPRGGVTITKEQSAAYDPQRIVLHGTFQNTSSTPYRYTFVVGVSARQDDGKPWTGEVEYLAGYERVQTPVLQPGELYNWQAELAVEDVTGLKKAGLASVEPHEPNEPNEPQTE